MSNTGEPRNIRNVLESVTKFSACISKCEALSQVALSQEPPPLGERSNYAALGAVGEHNGHNQTYESIVLE